MTLINFCTVTLLVRTRLLLIELEEELTQIVVSLSGIACLDRHDGPYPIQSEVFLFQAPPRLTCFPLPDVQLGPDHWRGQRRIDHHLLVFGSFDWCDWYDSRLGHGSLCGEDVHVIFFSLLFILLGNLYN
jgi:hypothetical protein